jgi:hypothetical protein
MSYGKPRYDYSKPYISDADRENERLIARDEARYARSSKSASLDSERQKQEYINMGLNILATGALTAPLGIVSGTAVGVGADYGIPALMADPTVSKGIRALSSLIPLRSGKPSVSQAEQDAAMAQSKAFQASAKAYQDKLLAEARAREASQKAAFHKPIYEQNVPFKSANIGPMTYIAPVVNTGDSQKQQRLDVYSAQQKQLLEDMKKTTAGSLEKQRAEIATLQSLQQSYYTALQSEVAQQEAARERVRQIEAAQLAQAQQALVEEPSRPTRKLPPTIDLKGKIVGRGRRK